jgi:hypothetical protein
MATSMSILYSIANERIGHHPLRIINSMEHKITNAKIN